MANKMRKAQYRGDLTIGDITIPCAVLDDGTRVISESGLTSTLGTAGGKNYRLRDKVEGAAGTGRLPLFLASKALEPFYHDVFDDSDLAPIEYVDDGGKAGRGYSATILPKVCEIWLKAREAKTLQASQLPKAFKAEILMRGLAHIGITALVDEVTGYQQVREKDALQQILSKYLTEQAKKWSKTFPDEFWFKLIKIKGYPSYIALKRPAYVGHWVNDIVYDRLAPGLKSRLNELNPRTEKGHRKAKHFQYLTDDHGFPELREHLMKVMFLMDAASNKNEFERLLNKALPRLGDTLSLDLDET
jgi:hypothetical protein